MRSTNWSLNIYVTGFGPHVSIKRMINGVEYRIEYDSKFLTTDKIQQSARRKIEEWRKWDGVQLIKPIFEGA